MGSWGASWLNSWGGSWGDGAASDGNIDYVITFRRRRR